MQCRINFHDTRYFLSYGSKFSGLSEYFSSCCIRQFICLGKSPRLKERLTGRSMLPLSTYMFYPSGRSRGYFLFLARMSVRVFMGYFSGSPSLRGPWHEYLQAPLTTLHDNFLKPNTAPTISPGTVPTFIQILVEEILLSVKRRPRTSSDS